MSATFRECALPVRDRNEYINFSRSVCMGHYNPCTKECYPWFDGYRADDFNDLWVEPHATVIYGMVYPVLVALTILANIFVVIVLTRKHMRTATNTILLYMAIADLFVAVVPFPFLTIFFVFGFNRATEQIETWWCYMAHYSATEVLPSFCHNVAIWLTVMLATQRLIYIRAPLSAAQICTIRNVNIGSFVIILMALLGTAPRFMDIRSYRVFNFKLKSSNENSTVILTKQSCIYQYTSVVRHVSEDRYFSSYYWTRVVAFVVIPSVLLILVSFVLIISIRKAQARRIQLGRRRSSANQAINVRDHTTTMLILIVVVFLVVNLPQGLILALFCVQQTFYQGVQIVDGRYMAIAMMIDNMLILATYPLNFAIYCSMSAAFRDTFKDLFCRSGGVASSTQRGSVHSHNSNSTIRNGNSCIRSPWLGNSECTTTTPLINATRL